MKKSVLSGAVAAVISGVALPAMADVNTELEELKARIAQLEAQQAEQAVSAPQWSDRVQLGAEFEFLAFAQEDKQGNTSSDFELDTAKITLEAQVNDFVAVAAEFKDDDGSVILDEAVVTITSADERLTFTGGKTGLPFAVVASEGWTSPLTDDFVDHTDTLAQLSWNQGIWNADVYAFNDGDSDAIDNLGVNLGVELDNGLALGAGFLNNIRNTESYDDARDNNEINTSGTLKGYRVNAAYTQGAMTVSAEYMTSGRLNERDDKRLSVWDISADYRTQLLGAPTIASVSYSETDNAANIFAQKRTVVGVNREFSENVSVAVEYVRDSEYDNSRTDTANLVLITSF